MSNGVLCVWPRGMITVSVLSANAAGLVCDSATRIVSGAVPPETLTRLPDNTSPRPTWYG